MSNNPWDGFWSTLGSDLENLGKAVTNELHSLGLGELAAYVPQVSQLISSLGGGDPLSLILETAQALAFGNGQALVAQALEKFFNPVTQPVQSWQMHKQNMADALQTHWAGMDERITQLYTSDQFSGVASQTLVEQHQQLKQNGQALYNHLVNSSQADTYMLASLQQAIQEKSSDIASLGPIGPFAALIALNLAPTLPPSPTQAPPQWIQELEKDVEEWFEAPLDPSKPLILRILIGIGEAIAAIGLAELAAAFLALGLIVFSIWLLWYEQQPAPRHPRNLNGPQPEPVPTPNVPVNSAEAASITQQLRSQGYNVSEEQIEELLAQGYSRDDIIKLITLLGLIYGKGNVGAHLDQFISYGYDYAIEVARILSKLKAPWLNPDTVYDLLSTDMGEDTHFTEDQVFQILNDLCSIYKDDPANGAQAVADAVQTLLQQGFDIPTTMHLAHAFAEYYRLMGQKTLRNRYGQVYPNPDYKATVQDRLNAIKTALSGLNYNNLNASNYRFFNSPNHAVHAREMGLSEDEYRQKAIEFLKGPPQGDELQLTRPNGDILRWNEDTGEFGILQSNGNVKTYYNIGTGDDAWLYFLRQANTTGE
jgi:hypothetical protein